MRFGTVVYAVLASAIAMAIPAHRQPRLAGVLAQVPSPPVRALSGHTGPVLSIAFSPNGKTIASGGADGTIRLWNATTGQLDETLVSDNYVPAVTALAYMPDGSTLFSGDANGNLRKWDMSTGKPDRIPLASSNFIVKQIVCAPNGNEIAVVMTRFQFGSAKNDRVTLRNAKTLREEACMTDEYSSQNDGWPICSVAFSPDSARVTMGISEITADTAVFDVWDSTAGKKLLTFGKNMVNRNCLPAYAPEGVGGVLACDDMIFAVDMDDILKSRGWDQRPGTYWFGRKAPRKGAWGAPEFKPTSLFYSFDGRFVISSGGKRKKDGSGVYIHFWDATTGAKRMEIPVLNQINGLACSPNGNLLAGAGQDGQVKLWDTSSLPASPL